jgi:hypothetical protein
MVRSKSTCLKWHFCQVGHEGKNTIWGGFFVQNSSSKKLGFLVVLTFGMSLVTKDATTGFIVCFLICVMWLSVGIIQHHLQPLPIMGFAYQWSLDFVCPLNLVMQHNLYILVMIKHFSKWLELVSLPNYSNERVAYAFLA